MNIVKPTKKPTLAHVTMKLIAVEDGKSYTTEDLISVLKEISFDKININLSCKKSYIGSNGLGYTSIGFVNKFNPEEVEFETVVFENRVDAIKALGDVAIAARVFTNKEGKITKVIGLDVEPVTAE